MAKGQKRSNREVKKPKKAKSAAPVPAAGAAWSTLERIQPTAAASRKK